MSNSNPSDNVPARKTEFQLKVQAIIDIAKASPRTIEVITVRAMVDGTVAATHVRK